MIDPSGLVYAEAISKGTNIIAAIKNGDIDIVQQLITAGIDYNAVGMWNNSPLIIACQYAKYDIAILLLNKNDININIINEKGATALLYACLEGYTDIVNTLLQKDVTVHTTPAIGIYNI